MWNGRETRLFSELPTSLLTEKKPGFGDQVFRALIPKLRLADMRLTWLQIQGHFIYEHPN